MMELVNGKKWFRNGLKIGGIAAGGVGFLFWCLLLIEELKYETWEKQRLDGGDVEAILVFLLVAVVFGLMGAVGGGATSAAVGVVAGKAITKWRMGYQKAVEIAAGTVGGIVIGFILTVMILALLIITEVIQIGCSPRGYRG
jgi:MFS family permease